jgi:hypothetical protein
MDLEVRDTTHGDVVDIAGLLGELGYARSAAQVRTALKAATGNSYFVLFGCCRWSVGGCAVGGGDPAAARRPPRWCASRR